MTRIRLNNANHTALFVKICNEFEEDIDVKYGRYTIDAKSIMGVLSMPLDKEFTVVIHTNSKEVASRFQELIDLWLVEGDK